MKKRLTITLDKGVLRQVDALIDDKTIRNRSHAIETLLSESLGKSIKKAVILAGGRKNKKPVSLRKINGRTLLHHQIENLKEYGINNLTICAGRFREDIEKVFRDGGEMGICINYLKEDKVLGTAGAVRKASEFIDNQKFLVLHGDVLTDFDLNKFMELHQSENTMATIAVIPRLAEKKFGKVMISGNKITKFVSEEGDKGISIVNAGVYIFEPEVFDLFPKKSPSYFEKDVFPVLARKRDLSAYIFQGRWYEVSRYKDYKMAKKKWLNSK